ncbi:hypothetical protein [Xanthomarina spongicola]|uniref:WG repeat protein n=1 Tax=Xanthomarina spongicola TaxID=570520 RepID=A0A316E706_9FLAO|nr:hypothetical protein [Xanthomarina spongicola]PWK18730.1 hypothetical protein LX78_02037 [Xanthomarina spongicola]
MKKTIWILIFMIAMSCGGEKIMIRNAAPGNGYIIGTFTLIDEKPRYNGYGLLYKPEDKKLGFFDDSFGISISRGLPHQKVENKRVYLFIKEHKVGDYEFFNYILSTNLGYSQKSIKSKKEFSIPFKVQEDSINYIGDFTFYPNGNENGNLFVIQDKFEQDLPKLKEKYPRKNWKIVQNKTLNKGVLNESLVEFK